MSEPTETIFCRALRAQRAALHRLEPSADLDARFEQSLQAWGTDRARATKRRRRSWALAGAATVVLLSGAGWLAWHVRAPQPATPGVRKSGYVRVASPDAQVLRVQASLGAPLPVWARNGFAARARRYWVDVGIAGDGSLYIERVIPADDDPELFIP
jgi:hypothetical protein